MDLRVSERRSRKRPTEQNQSIMHLIGLVSRTPSTVSSRFDCSPSPAPPPLAALLLADSPGMHSICKSSSALFDSNAIK
ncbi:hypothetical protein CCH79_00004050, partial [Gambusia affinis]